MMTAADDYSGPMSPGQEASSQAAASRRKRRRSQRQIDESAENRREIVQQAMRLFARYGYTKTTLQGVADQVGLTRTGLLHHFGSKEGLFAEVLKEGRRGAEGRLVLRGGDGDLRGLNGLRLTRNYLGIGGDDLNVKFVQMMQAEALHEDAPEDLVAFAELRVNRVREYIEQRLREAQQDGKISDIDAPAAAVMMTAAINGLQVQKLLDPSVDTDAALSALLELIARPAS
jgi:AcrR family transcriptional regulator